MRCRCAVVSLFSFVVRNEYGHVANVELSVKYRRLFSWFIVCFVLRGGTEVAQPAGLTVSVCVCFLLGETLAGFVEGLCVFFLLLTSHSHIYIKSLRTQRYDEFLQLWTKCRNRRGPE